MPKITQKKQGALGPSDYCRDNHANHLFLLGREIIERLNDNDDDKRKLSPGDLILHYVDDEGGPLLSFWSPDIKSELTQHMAYDSTCRKLLKFLERGRT